MNNLILFINSFLSYLLVMAVIVILAGIAIFIGIKLRKNKNAKVEQIDAFSAHADYQEMINWLGKIDTTRLKQIFLVHGEQDALNGFTQHLWDAGFKDVTTIKYGEYYNLD